MSSSGESRLQRQRRRQLLEAARSRYQLLSYQEKGALVDELVELSGYHRKSVLRLLRQQPADHGGPPARTGADHESAAAIGRRRYGPEVVQLLETLWEASDHLCGKRLAAVLPTLVEALERHGHLEIEPVLKGLLLQVSPATIDRLLAPARSAQGGQHRRRRSRLRPCIGPRLCPRKCLRRGCCPCNWVHRRYRPQLARGGPGCWRGLNRQ